MKLLEMPRRADGGSVTVLPMVWATEGNLAQAMPVAEPAVAAEAVAARQAYTSPVFRVVLSPQMAFYRSYTEAMLRRYAVMRTESGRVPSMLGRELMRGKATHYRVHGFDDVVIFVHDVEQCLKELSEEQQKLVLRVSIQEYTFAEVAGMLTMSLRSVKRRYREAIDELTSVFLRKRLLERVASDPCQEGEVVVKLVSHTPERSCG